MGRYRKDRINEEMTRELCEIIRTVKDPRVSGRLISILRSEVTADLKYAKIYYSVLDPKNREDDERETQEGLRSAQKYLRGQIAERMNLRITPELTFIYDDSIVYSAKISTILHSESVQADLARFAARTAQEAEASEQGKTEDEFDD